MSGDIKEGDVWTDPSGNEFKVVPMEYIKYGSAGGNCVFKNHNGMCGVTDNCKLRKSTCTVKLVYDWK